MRMVLLSAFALGCLAGCSTPETRVFRADSSGIDLPGVHPDGAVLLPNQWWLRPVGKQLALGDFPVQIALHPGGQFAAVLHCGYGPHEVAVVDVTNWKLLSRAQIPEAFYGLAFSPNGSELFCSSAGEERIHRFAFADGYLDQCRADRFISELARFEKAGEMPRLQILRLPNDHTSGTTAGKYTPQAAVADNDLAFGRIIEAISHSRFWPQTAIFVVEDDAQNGPDHVDAHRTIAFVISPYVKRGAVDSTLYSTSSMLRTIELILGLRPMSQFDAAAMPMYNSFQATPDLRPYQHLKANVDITLRNSKLAWGGEISERMDFSKEDAADDLLLNEVIWRSVRGADSPMPAPTRAAFVFPHSTEKEK